MSDDSRSPAGRRKRAGLQERRPPAPRARPKRGRKAAAKAPSPAPKASKRKVRIDNVVSVGQLAHEMGVKATLVIRELIELGHMATVNEMLDFDTAALVAAEFDYQVENVGFQEEQVIQAARGDEVDEDQSPRPPVVTIMGHVDHGKTTLLDTIRSAKVAAGEAGGITQHIGAYQVEVDDQKITFIDTPGHAAFTEMRARGASVTDIVILVVAADDGVQAQTEEAIAHAKAAGVPIIVAVNKMDKPGVSPDPIKQRLTEYGLVPEEWGGETMFVPVSALKATGIDELLEAIVLQAEVLELTANPDRAGEGVVIEAQLDRGRGPVATVLVQTGTLKAGDPIVIGSTSGRVRAMVDHRGKRLKSAGPSTPVEVFGFGDLPEVGDSVIAVKTDKDARALAEHRAEFKRQAAFGIGGRRTAEDIFALGGAEEKQYVDVIVKGDVQGSVEALKGALMNLQVEGVELRILHSAAGEINESDISLANANGATVIGFNVRPDANARRFGDSVGVKPEIFTVIYAAIDYVSAMMKGLLAPEMEEISMGAAEVRAVFDISRIGRVAGCYVTDGKIGRTNTVRIFRNDKQIWEGRLKALKRFKDDVREVSSGYECGMSFEGYDAVEVGDIVKTSAMQEVAGS